MPRKSRSAPVAVVDQAGGEEQDEEEAQEEAVGGHQGSLPGLQFDEPLTWRAGKPIAVAELLRRLQALSKELGDMEQEENDRDSFTKVAKELAHPNLLGHKDRGVRAWTACCLVDMLRLCAPDAPYTGAQLKDIFTLFITSILPSLSDPSNAYNNQHMYVLQSLARVKSIVLLTDIPSSEALILHLFTSFFDILSGSSKSSTGEQIGKNVEFHMTAILVILVDEATSLPTEVVDIIVAQFLRADPRVLTGGSEKSKKAGAAPVVDEKQATLLLKELPPAYNMAKTICNSCPERMARNVSQYFNDVILDASNSTGANGAGKPHPHRRTSKDFDESDDEEGLQGPTEEDLKELHKAHRLMRELWRASPAVLQSVIPQLEAELSTENVQLRLLATETLGDIVSGIGAAGPPPVPIMDPSAYPPATLDAYSTPLPNSSILTTPSSPQPFPQTHPAAYNSFLNRKYDKSAIIRSAWTTGVGRILATSAGGVGLSQSDEQMLVTDFATKLGDADERVRLAAVKAVAAFSLGDVVMKLGSIGGVDKEGSLLSNLAARARDRRHGVRAEGMKTLGRIWGVAAGEIAAGNETVRSGLGSIPSKLFDTFYVNDLDINVLLDHVIFDLLIPLNYPPVKSKAGKAGGTESQSRRKGGETNGEKELAANDADRIRTERILNLVKDLDPKAKKAFFALQARQVQLSKVMQTFLKRCEDYNGGVMDDNEAEIKTHLTRLIEWFSKTLPDSPRVSADLWKFAKMHDRRSYQLVRFCMDPDSDYRTVHKAIREISKRIEAAPGSPAGMLETLTPLLYRTSLLVYNKSHVPSIVQLSRTEERGLASTAHETLNEISTRNPEVFKAHVNELCRILQDQAPSAKKTNEAGTVDTLKACARFARRFPKEMPQDRRFLQSLVNFALYGTPPAAKHAVTIIMAAAERKEMYGKDLVQKSIKGYEFGSANFLARLATLSQLWLLAPQEVDEEADAVVDIAIKEVLLKNRTARREQQADWLDDEELDDECKAKVWALRLLVNRLRSHRDGETATEIARPVFQLLNTLVAKEGELSKKKDTPAPHRSRLRLAAGQLLLKLCTSKQYDEMLTPKDFNKLACMAQDGLFQVRFGFVNKLKKYLGQAKLAQRFYAVVFLMAYEPRLDFREETVTWIRSRAHHFAAHKQIVMESVFARLLSLLAHHPDFGTDAADLADFARYILFYLLPVATEENLSLVFHVAQRVKQTVDALDPAASANLYHLSDLAQAVIRRYEDAHGWSMQTWPGRLRLPAGLFGALPSHAAAQEIATRTYLPDAVNERLDALVKAKAKPSKKRKSEYPLPPTSASHAKKAKPAASASTPKKRRAAKARTPKNKKVLDEVPSSDRRRSARAATGRKVATYAEGDSDEDEDVEEEEEDGEEEDGEEEDGEEEDDDEEGDDEEAEGEHDEGAAADGDGDVAMGDVDGPGRRGHHARANGRKKAAVDEGEDAELSDPPDSD